jgi:hypothetical protein
MNARLLRPLASGFNPKSIAGLEAWYAADVASSITIATGVQQWSDLSGKGRHLVQNVTNNQPAHNSVTLNGKPTVTFDGMNDSMRVAFTLTQPYAYFAVMRFEVITGIHYLLDGRNQASGSRSGEVLVFSNNKTLFAGGLFSLPATPAGAMTTFNVWDYLYNGSSSVIRLRKTAANATGNAGSNNGSGLTLAAASGAVNDSSFGNCSWAELLVYSKSVPEAEADRIRKYLGTKWGLAYLS